MQSQIKRDRIDYSYAIIDTRDIECEKLLNSDDPSAIALSILCDFEGKDKQSVVNTIIRKLRELNDDRAFEDYLEMITLYSTNRDLEKEVQKGVEMLTYDIEKIPFFQDGLKVGMEKGFIQGKLEERFENAIVMIKEFQLAIDNVVAKLNIKKEELLEYMKEKRGE